MKKYLLMAVVAIVTVGSAAGVSTKDNHRLHQLIAKPAKTAADIKGIAAVIKKEPTLVAAIKAKHVHNNPAAEQTAWTNLLNGICQPLTGDIKTGTIKEIANAVSLLPALYTEVTKEEPKKPSHIEQFGTWAHEHKEQLKTAVKAHPYRTTALICGTLGAAAGAALLGHFVGYGTIARMLPNFMQAGISKVVPSFVSTATLKGAIETAWNNKCFLSRWFGSKAAVAQKVTTSLLGNKVFNPCWLSSVLSLSAKAQPKPCFLTKLVK